jgi:hypothetical protein
MDIHKQLSFIGDLKKQHQEDTQPIENFSASINCHKNGNVFLEINSKINEKLGSKKFLESVPIYTLKDPSRFTEEEIADPFFCFTLDNSDREPVQSPYEGDYIIEGKTSEGWSIQAKVADPSFKVSFGCNETREAVENTQNNFVKLSNLYVDYCPQISIDNGKILKVSHGLSNLDLFDSFSALFLDYKYEISLISLTSRDSNNPEILSSEMTLKVVNEDETEIISYSTYFAWFELLISLATGKCLKEIYRVETSQSNDKQKKVEYWSGNQFFQEGRGIAVIQQVNLSLFIQQCALKVTQENFSAKGLGSALRWYTDAFISNIAPVKFILLCTVLETLNKHHSTEASSRLIPTSIYREIRDEILGLLDKHKYKFDDENDLQKYEKFKNKLEKSFSGFNKLGSLRTNLEQMLDFHKTPYKDLFPALEFIKTRDDIVHEGFGGEKILPELFKLQNLVVRLVLSMLQYNGEYVEYRRVEVGNSTDFEKYGLAYKIFPFEDEH